ncbi:hypothetical protein H4R20_000636 [Coemansia guatemalensis]|uniref:Stress-response A/B barrel domain-containing protein n=1 Tax=Coemansia guatemalensis TaxID=2761395 RepID=A0A9W8I7C5_9FUNG|nr:hypothetical protein H4R20_000636 [Coemansia guatemalensis]
MSFIHIVLLPVSPNAPQELVDQVIADLNRLSEQIPFVTRSSCGKTVTQRGRQYTHALLVELERAEQLSEYAVHPVHQAVLAKIKAIVAEETLAIDFSDTN